jgi:hypothetical protein
MARHARPPQTILLFLRQGTEREHVAETKTIKTITEELENNFPRIRFCLPQLSLENTSSYVEFLLAAKGRESEKERERERETNRAAKDQRYLVKVYLSKPLEGPVFFSDTFLSLCTFWSFQPSLSISFLLLHEETWLISLLRLLYHPL